MASPSTQAKQHVRNIADRLASWIRPEPLPPQQDSPPRVEVTPPSRVPAGWRGAIDVVREDIESVLCHDPAANDPLEVCLVYPGLHALWMHRVAHMMWVRGHRLPSRVLAHMSRFATGIEIHPGARIGRRVFIDHGMGIVIGETAVVGDDCLLYKGVVLGGTSLERAERHPTLGAGVVAGTNACILGAIQVGDGARVGSGSVVIRDVPARATVVGIPGRLAEGVRDVRAELDHAALPDPVANVLSSLIEEVESLRREVAHLRGDDVPRPAGRDREDGNFDDVTTLKSDGDDA